MLENPIETFSVKKQLMMFFFTPEGEGSRGPLRWGLHSHQTEIRVLHAWKPHRNIFCEKATYDVFLTSDLWPDTNKQTNKQTISFHMTLPTVEGIESLLWGPSSFLTLEHQVEKNSIWLSVILECMAFRVNLNIWMKNCLCIVFL